MRIITVVFDVDNTKLWTRMARIFCESVKKHMPGMDFILKVIRKPHRVNGTSVNRTYNNEKLKIWNEYQQKSTENTIFMDSDMLCLNSFETAFIQNFDIALTVNKKIDFPPLNAGVVFARPTVEAKAFFRQWVKIDNLLYNDNNLHGVWAGKYLGQNQASLGYLLDQNDFPGKVQYMPNRFWNCTDLYWHTINDNTIFVHLKGVLRTELLNNVAPHHPYAKIMQMWYDMDTEFNGVDHSSFVNRRIPRGRVRR